VGVSLKGESPATVMAMLRDRLVPAVRGLDVLDLEKIQQEMERAVPWNYRAKSAVNLAAVDLAGQVLATPASALLGGRVRDAIPLSWSIPLMEVEDGVQEAEDRVAQGWQIIKAKLGRPNPADDVEMVRALREALGPRVRLRVDANQAYDVKTAIRIARALERFDLDFFEQPVAWWDLDGLAEVSRATDLPIMADESSTTIFGAVEVVKRRAAQCFSIYVSASGGLLNAKKMADLGAAFGIASYVGSALEGPLGVSAGLHLAAACAPITLGCELYAQFLLEEDLAVRPFTFRDGALCVPTGPGLGVALDHKKLRHYTLDSFEVM
jgi:L-alanine-DL-glutamate epimerase-like enolase superfamily enzyme